MMILQHSATGPWLIDGPLSARGARLLRSRRPGWLSVSAGRVWVTRSGDLDDHVLAAGQAMAVGAHEKVVVEPWTGGSPACLAWRSDQPRGLATRAAGFLATLADRFVALVLRGAAWLRSAGARETVLARNAAAKALRAQGAIACAESSASSGAVQ
jgi:hypothetical protein